MRRIAAAVSALFASLGFAAGAAAQPAQPETPPVPDAAERQPDVVYVSMDTNKGEVLLELNRQLAPVSVDNFLRYVEEDFYSGVVFHRIVPGFVVQAGGFTRDMQQKETHAPIVNEWRNQLSNTRGTIALARTNNPNSATSQFYINLTDNPRLDGSESTPGYAVFGEVISGMDVVVEIAGTMEGADQGAAMNPADPVVIEGVSVIDGDRLEELREAHLDERLAANETLLEQKKAAEEARAAERAEELRKGKQVLEQNELEYSDERTLDTGQWVAIVEEGEGEDVAEVSDTVEVHYRGWLTNASQFDSSFDRGSPATFPLARVVPGFRDAIAGQREGTKLVTVIPPEQGYGPRGSRTIPPNSFLVFEVHILDIK